MTTLRLILGDQLSRDLTALPERQSALRAKAADTLQRMEDGRL